VTSAIIVVLLSVCGWLVLKLTIANKDNAELRIRIDSLKRQLLRAR
jgi:hypothetical protein